MEHEAGCKCAECCYPQRQPVPKTEQGEAKVRPGAAKECCEKQYGDAGWN